MDSRKKMTDEQKEDLSHAVSQLSEEDQMQIAGGRISDEQCKKIKKKINPAYLNVVAYGCPTPKIDLKFKMSSSDAEIPDKSKATENHKGEFEVPNTYFNE